MFQRESAMDWFCQVSTMSSVNRMDVFTDSWKEDIIHNKKLQFYNDVKPAFGKEPYLNLERNLAKWVARLRSGAHRFNVETGRHQKYRISSKTEDIVIKERACPSCTTDDLETFELLTQLPFRQNIVEDEKHVLLQCPSYAHIREQHLEMKEPRLPIVHLRHIFKETPHEVAIFLRKANRIRHQVPTSH